MITAQDIWSDGSGESISIRSEEHGDGAADAQDAMARDERFAMNKAMAR